MNKNLLSTIYLLLLCGLMIGLGIFSLQNERSNTRLRDEVAYYRMMYPQKHGFVEGWGNYDLRSLDGGFNWYAVTSTNVEVVILGTAEQVFPGLMNHIIGMDKLISYAESNGPVRIGSGMDNTQSNLLKQAGFTITVTNRP